MLKKLMSELVIFFKRYPCKLRQDHSQFINTWCHELDKGEADISHFLEDFITWHVGLYYSQELGNDDAVSFFNHFNQLSKKMREESSTDITCFLKENGFIIDKLIKLIGKETFYFMQKMMVNSTSPLIVFFNYFYDEDQCDFISISQEKNAKTLCKRFHKNLRQDEGHRTFKQIIIQLLAISILEESSTNDDFSDNLESSNINSLFFLNLAKTCSNLSEFYTKANQELYKIIYELTLSEKLDDPSLLNNIEKQLPLFLLPELIHVREKLKNHEYASVLDEILLVTLKQKQPFMTFATELNNENTEISSLLVKHNQAILNRLKEGGIDIDKALYYSKKLAFQFGGEHMINIGQKAQAIYASLQETEKALSILREEAKKYEFPKSWQKDLDNINKNITDIVKAFKGNHEPENIKNTLMKNAGLSGHVTKLTNKLNDLIKYNPNAPYPDAISSQGKEYLDQAKKIINTEKNIEQLLTYVIEHGTHLCEHYKELKILLPTVNKQKILSAQIKQYHVERWDKNKLSTLFLGNLLSCCLASNGSQFPAMIQRYMDVAMFMDVVIDEQSQLPVCGNWLFFAEDKENPDDLYVVANFFEINSGISANTDLSKTLVDHLLYFTGEFAREVGAKGFIMRPLTYGMIPDFNQFGDAKQISIKKIGGALGEDEAAILEESTIYKKTELLAASSKIKKHWAADPAAHALSEAILSFINHNQNDINHAYRNMQKAYFTFKSQHHLVPAEKKLLSAVKDFIENHEERCQKTTLNHYYLAALELNQFYFYNPEAMKNSEVFNPACQKVTPQKTSPFFFFTVEEKIKTEPDLNINKPEEKQKGPL